MVKLPFGWKLPFIGEKTKLNYTFLEDDKFKEQYLVRLRCELPESIVKRFYDFTLKKKLGVEFSAGLLEGETIKVPDEFLEQRQGIFTWEDVLIKQADKVFDRLSKNHNTYFVTKHLKTLKISKHKKNKYSAYFEIIGKKALKNKHRG